MNYKEAWNQFIQDHGPYKYHFTITFNTHLSDDESFKSMVFYLHLLNQKIFGARYKKNNQHLEGFIFAESHIDGDTHYHLLLKDNPLFHAVGKPPLVDHINTLLSKVKKPGRFGHTERQVLSPVGICFDEINDNGIIGYFIKTLRRYSNDKAQFIGVLGIDGTDRITPAK
jgi:hypothetical protein